MEDMLNFNWVRFESESSDSHGIGFSGFSGAQHEVEAEESDMTVDECVPPEPDPRPRLLQPLQPALKAMPKPKACLAKAQAKGKSRPGPKPKAVMKKPSARAAVKRRPSRHQG